MHGGNCILHFYRYMLVHYIIAYELNFVEPLLNLIVQHIPLLHYYPIATVVFYHIYYYCIIYGIVMHMYIMPYYYYYYYY
jgi:hypothetical protein